MESKEEFVTFSFPGQPVKTPEQEAAFALRDTDPTMFEDMIDFDSKLRDRMTTVIAFPPGDYNVAADDSPIQKIYFVRASIHSPWKMEVFLRPDADRTAVVREIDSFASDLQRAYPDQLVSAGQDFVWYWRTYGKDPAPSMALTKSMQTQTFKAALPTDPVIEAALLSRRLALPEPVAAAAGLWTDAKNAFGAARHYAGGRGEDRAFHPVLPTSTRKTFSDKVRAMLKSEHGGYDPQAVEKRVRDYNAAASKQNSEGKGDADALHREFKELKELSSKFVQSAESKGLSKLDELQEALAVARRRAARLSRPTASAGHMSTAAAASSSQFITLDELDSLY